jgi:hypothetical protein
MCNLKYLPLCRGAKRLRLWLAWLCVPRQCVRNRVVGHVFVRLVVTHVRKSIEREREREREKEEESGKSESESERVVNRYVV